MTQTRRTGHEHLVDYSADLLGGPIDHLVREHSRVLGLACEASEELRTANHRDLRKAADVDHLQAAAIAFAAGQRDPGTPAATALDKRIADAERRAQVANAAVRSAYVALRDAVEEHRDDWTADLDLQQQAAAAEVNAALDQVLPLLARVGHLRRVSALVEDLESRRAYNKGASVSSVALPGLSTTMPVPTLLDSIVAEASPRPRDTEPVHELPFVEGAAGRTIRAGLPISDTGSLV